LRQGYQRVKQRYHDWRNRRRNEPKKQPPSKDQRLAAAVERIRPRAGQLIRHGVRGVVLRAALAAMRLWYRLTALAVDGLPHFQINARLNPEEFVVNGFVVPRDRLIEFLHEVAEEIVEKPRVQADRIVEGSREASVSPKTGKPRQIAEYTIPGGVNLPAVLAQARAMRHRGWGSKEILSFLHEQPEQVVEPSASELGRRGSAAAAEIARQQQAGRVRNKVVKLLQEGKEVRTDLAYSEIAKALPSKGPSANKALGHQLAAFAAGDRPGGSNGGLVAFLGTLMVVQEGHRNPRALVSAGMVIQMLQEGNDFEQTIAS